MIRSVAEEPGTVGRLRWIGATNKVARISIRLVDLTQGLAEIANIPQGLPYRGICSTGGINRIHSLLALQMQGQ